VEFKLVEFISLKISSVGMESYRCVVCQEEITSEEHNYSTKFYNMALCRKHQEIQKHAKAKAELEQKTKVTSEDKTSTKVDKREPKSQIQKNNI